MPTPCSSFKVTERCYKGPFCYFSSCAHSSSSCHTDDSLKLSAEKCLSSQKPMKPGSHWENSLLKQKYRPGRQMAFCREEHQTYFIVLKRWGNRSVSMSSARCIIHGMQSKHWSKEVSSFGSLRCYQYSPFNCVGMSHFGAWLTAPPGQGFPAW